LLQQFYGPGDNPDAFLTRVARACIAGDPLELTAGTQERDFIHIDDTVTAILAVLDNPGGSFRRMPVGSGVSVKVRTVVELIHGLSASHSKMSFGAVPMRRDEPARSVADISNLRALGWSPRVELPHGLADLVSAERANMKRSP
jgi:nucleoside-diphosphate-sugar epimerase